MFLHISLSNVNKGHLFKNLDTMFKIKPLTNPLLN